MGKKVAETLMREMRFLGEYRGQDGEHPISLPERDELQFQIIQGKAAAKYHALSQITKSEDPSVNILSNCSANLN